MKYLKDLQEHERVIEHYFCKQKQSLKTRSGKTYYSLKLQDKTAVLDAKIWEINNDIAHFEEGDVVKIDGSVLLYQTTPQIKIARIRKSLDGEYDMSEFLPSTKHDVEEMYGKLLGFIDSVTNPYLKQLLENIILGHEVIADTLKTHSAAKNMHHSYMGGLLEHTLAVTTICDFMAGMYPFADRDFLITTAILHDIAKIFELSPLPDNNYTDVGQLLGHIYLGAELIHIESAKIENFPDDLARLLKHAILAHHGEYEFGSPKLPSTIESFILHCADNLDAKVKAFEESVANDLSAGLWTNYNKILGRYLRKSGYNAEEPASRT